MTITVVFDPPLPSDSPSTFNTKAFTLLGDLNTWSSEANAMPASFASSVSTALAAPPAIGGTTPNAVTATTLTATSGPLGYGVGAGGTVTQATSKVTAVTLNKPCGQVVTSNASLAAGASVSFVLSNTLITTADVVNVGIAHGSVDAAFYSVRAAASSTYAYITLTNTSGSTLSEAVPINFAIIKGATS